MLRNNGFMPFVPVGHLKVWVLIPSVFSTDQNINYYYDFKESFKEFQECFEKLKLPWIWQTVTNNNYKQVLAKIRSEKEEGSFFPVVFNLCDGDNHNDVPGLNIIYHLEELKIVYTGADAEFYKLTTAKITMKECFEKNKIPTAPWQIIDSNIKTSNLKFPVIIKPNVSAGSLGLNIQNVVSDNKNIETVFQDILQKDWNWDIAHGGYFMEEYIKGQEFTSFIIGSYTQPQHIKVYPPVERVFHHSLPECEKFLSYERLWEIYQNEKPMPNNEDFFKYNTPSSNLVKKINDLSLATFCCLNGTGYARIDFRYDGKNFYVLEANAQCGLSEDENFTSIGAILRLNKLEYSTVIIDIINDAFARKFQHF